jgi:hypothetical protein
VFNVEQTCFAGCASGSKSFRGEFLLAAGGEKECEREGAKEGLQKGILKIPP